MTTRKSTKKTRRTSTDALRAELRAVRREAKGLAQANAALQAELKLRRDGDHRIWASLGVANVLVRRLLHLRSVGNSMWKHYRGDCQCKTDPDHLCAKTIDVNPFVDPRDELTAFEIHNPFFHPE